MNTEKYIQHSWIEKHKINTIFESPSNFLVRNDTKACIRAQAVLKLIDKLV